ncbi:hypothetical protein HDU87_001184 [Geranomyces variabilis]|uniref:Uncharacterized protein n=1 Tax=Geranomyces variabilis TaxID=109894 RepID=A0AAD5TDT1_9FUNG|nr:hypothetical protein HDU87_001184 [Geranomyces variabilis]
MARPPTSGGDHESHFAVLPGAEVRIVSYMLTDEDEIDRAEEIVKNWFEVAAEPQKPTGPKLFAAAESAALTIRRLVLLPATSLPKAVTLYKQHQQQNFARDGRLLRDTIEALNSQAESLAREIRHLDDYQSAWQKRCWKRTKRG